MRVLLVFAVLSLALATFFQRRLRAGGRARLAWLAFAITVAPAIALGAREGIPAARGPVAPEGPRELHPGVTYRRLVQTEPRLRVTHVIAIDLAREGLRLAATRPDDPGESLPYRARKTSAFAEDTGAVAAINGDFFDPWRPGLVLGYPRPGDPVRTLGTTWSDGRKVATPGQGVAQLALGPGTHARFGAGPEPGGDVVGGLCMLVASGAPADLTPCGPKKPYQVHPRTAVALDQERRTMWLVVVDGRQPRYSLGAELDELASLLVDLGAHDAMNLDGGGSSALAVRAPGGGVELLGSPIADRIPGRERPVANHIGVFAD